MVDRIDVGFSATDGTKSAAWLFRPANRVSGCWIVGRGSPSAVVSGRSVC